MENNEKLLNYKNEIRGFIKENFAIDDDSIELNDDDNYFQLRFVNSLFAMKLVNYVEQMCDIEIDNEELDIKNFSSINSLMNLISNKLINTAA